MRKENNYLKNNGRLKAVNKQINVIISNTKFEQLNQFKYLTGYKTLHGRFTTTIRQQYMTVRVKDTEKESKRKYLKYSKHRHCDECLNVINIDR